MISLYDDQEEFVGEIRKLWKSHLRIVGYAQTGFGKTRVAARIIEGFTARGMTVCFVVPRITLIQQTCRSFIDLGLEDITLQWGDTETDERALITISSIDTMIRRPKRSYDLVIVDECHKRREQLLRWMDEFPDERYLGLSATPFAGWIGEYYTGLAKSKPMRWLIDNKRLSEYEIYAPSVPDLSKVNSRNTSMGYDYVESELEAVMGDYKVIGNIVQNWLEHGENRLTMALCVNVSHANHLMLEFQKAGVSAEVITAKTKIEERERIFQRSKEGITRVVLSVDCLTEGYDQPEMTCLINARPTKSRTRYAQGMGRVLRYLKGKIALIFDHSGTSIDLGFPEDITISELQCGNNGESKEVNREPEEKLEKKAKKCASCNFLKPAGVYVCPKCGFKPVVGEDVETDESRGLKKVKGKKKVFTTEDKQLWYSQFLGFQKERLAEGKKASDGYISHLYKAKFGVWPRGLSSRSIGAGPEVRRYIKSRQIAYAKGLKSENNRSNQG